MSVVGCAERARDTVTGVVLCGGRSRRMGRDKALAVVEGRTLLEQAVAVLAEVAGEVALACGPEPRYAELGLPLALDGAVGDGPLAGLEAALAHAARVDREWVCVLACDMPRADAAVLARMLARAREGDLDACFFASSRGDEPLFGVYRRSCLEPIRHALASGERRAIAFHTRHRSDGSPLAVEAFRDPAHDGVARNVNTPEDLAAERAIRERSPA